MSTPIIAFCNNRAGVGTTALVYHLGWMLSDLGVRVLLADLDPQADLSVACLGYDRVEGLLMADSFPSIYYLVDGRMRGIVGVRPSFSDILRMAPPLLVGDPRLARLEELPNGLCLDLSAAFAQILSEAAGVCQAEVVLVDFPPNLGALNRAGVMAADYLVVPLGSEFFTVQGLRNLGAALQNWKRDTGGTRGPRPLGYVIQTQSMLLNRPVRFYGRWVERIPGEFRRSLLGDVSQDDFGKSYRDDEWCLAMLKPHHGLTQIAQQAQKPMFHLTAADGAIGSYFQAAQDARGDFEKLARRIAGAAGLKLPV